MHSFLTPFYRDSAAVNIFTIFALSAGFQLSKINIGNTGNQNHPMQEMVGFTVI